MLKVAIVGGGFTGLAAGVELVDSGEQVTVFEAAKSLGGLAGCFKAKNWKWSLEVFYHHIFSNDNDILSMAKRVGAEVTFHQPLTTSFINGKELQLDTPLSVLKFPELSLFSRLWMGAGLALLKIIPNGVFLEKFTAVGMLPYLIGREAYKKIWERLLDAKFGPYVNKVNMAWFWARVAKRTKSLGYFDGGFVKLAEAMRDHIIKYDGDVRLGQRVKKIEKSEKGWLVDGEQFDKVIMTTPAKIADKLVPGSVSWPKIDYLWAETLILETKRSLIDGYWMNVLEEGWPFLVLVEHTHMIDKSNYGGHNLIYLGNYLPDGDDRLEMSDAKLLQLFMPYLKKVCPELKKEDILNKWKFSAPFAQPVFPTDYSSKVPGFVTKKKDLYLANMSMVYPHDRGTNYAVKMGVEVAKFIRKN